MASSFYLVVKSDSCTAPSCLTLPLAKHCHPSPIKIYTWLCLSVLKSAIERFSCILITNNFFFAAFQQSLLSVIDGRGQDSCFHYCHKWFPSLWPGDAFSIQILATLTPPVITGCYWPWLLTWGGGGGNQGVENHHGPAQTRHSRDLCWDSLHFNKPYDNNKSCKNTKSLKNDLVFPFYLYKRLFPTAWGWFVVKFWSKDLSIFYKKILQ